MPNTANITNRWTGAVVFSTDTEDGDPAPMRTALSRALASGANLSGANLSDAYLSDAYLSGANLRGANLSGANLSDAYLSDAYLSGANLRGANLSDAYLRGANLRGANLSGANLSGANLSDAYLSDAYLSGANLSDAYLSDAYLRGANLRGANLRGANLDPIRDDFRSRLDRVPAEVPGLLAAIREGKIDGSAYEGACACFVGTVAKIRGCEYSSIPGLLPEASSLTEKFFLGIAPGHTPDTHPISAIVDDWICEWQAARGEGEFIGEAQS